MDETEAGSDAVPFAGGPPGLRPGDRRLLEALGDPVSLRILSALGGGERDGHRLVVETNLPQSSVYRKLHDLLAGELIRVSRLAFTPERRKVEVYASRIRGVSVDFEGGGLRVRVRSREEDASDRLRELWDQVRG